MKVVILRGGLGTRLREEAFSGGGRRGEGGPAVAVEALQRDGAVGEQGAVGGELAGDPKDCLTSAEEGDAKNWAGLM